MKNPIFYVMIGLPGSGKSHWVKQNIPDATVCSADHYFYDENGKYQFSPYWQELDNAHKQCFQVFQTALSEKKEQIVLDNANLQKWQYQRYVNLAEQNGYDVKFINIGDGGLTDEQLAARNAHNVPIEAYPRMRQRLNSGA